MAIDVYRERRADMHITNTAGEKPQRDREQRRIESVIQEFERSASQAEELGGRLTALLDRTGGTRPQDAETTSEPKAIPNGYLETLNALTRRLDNANEHTRKELCELESLL